MLKKFFSSMGAVRDFVRAGDALANGENSLALGLMDDAKRKLGSKFEKPSLIDVQIRHAFAATLANANDKARDSLSVAKRSLHKNRSLTPDDRVYLETFCRSLAADGGNLDIFSGEPLGDFDLSAVGAERKRNFPMAN